MVMTPSNRLSGEAYFEGVHRRLQRKMEDDHPSLLLRPCRKETTYGNSLPQKICKGCHASRSVSPGNICKLVSSDGLTVNRGINLVNLLVVGPAFGFFWSYRARVQILGAPDSESSLAPAHCRTCTPTVDFSSVSGLMWIYKSIRISVYKFYDSIDAVLQAF